jgi:cytochrome c biogenesis protein CcmG/thiol:disulfide interchange protein DsbE
MADRRPLLIVLAAIGVAFVGWGIASAVNAGSGGDDPAVVTTASRVPPPPTTQDLRPAVPGVAEVGAPAPAIDLPSLVGGARVRAAGGGPGAPTLINFWASWCIPCRREFPMLGRVNATYAPQGLRMVGVTFKDSAAPARRFAKAQSATWQLGYDANGAAAKAYGVRAAPQTVLVATDGRIVQRWFGAPTEAELDAAVAALVAG